MAVMVASRDQVQQAGLTIAGRNAAMVRDLPDLDIPIPHSEWTVGEAAAHLAFTTLGMAMMARGLVIPYGDGTREGLALANEVALEGFSERDGAVLADRMVEATAMLFDEAAAQPPDRICSTPMGTMPVEGLTAYQIVHHSMHGSAIATAIDAALPFDPEHVALMWPFIAPVLPRIVDPVAAAGVSACFELAFGDVLRFALTFDDGVAQVSPEPGREVDCLVAGDPQVLFLVMVKVATMQAAVAADAVALSGPRPDLGLRLPDLLNMP